MFSNLSTDFFTMLRLSVENMFFAYELYEVASVIKKTIFAHFVLFGRDEFIDSIKNLNIILCLHFCNHTQAQNIVC